jgi:hypothetical protein
MNATNGVNMEDRTSKMVVGTKILVSHNGKRTCCGATATVVKATHATFQAECSCGWNLCGMQSDRYERVSHPVVEYRKTATGEGKFVDGQLVGYVIG